VRALGIQHSVLLRNAVILYILHILLHHKIALAELFAFFSLFCLAWAIARGEVRPSFHILYYPLFLYGLISSISALAADKRMHQGLEGMLWFKMMIFPVAIILYREVPKLRELVLYPYALLAGGSSIWALVQFTFLDQRDLEHRISGPSSHVMTFSGLLLPLSLVFLILWLHQRKPLFLAVALLSTLTLLLTFTRSVWLGWGVAVFVLLMLTRSQIRYFAVPALLVFVTFLPLDLFGRLISVFDMKKASNFERVRMVQAGVEMIRDHPVLGLGPANVKQNYSLYRKADVPSPRPPHLHNNIVQLWAERGILGLGAYILFLVLFLRHCAMVWKTNRMWAEIGVAVATSITIAGLFEFNFGDTEVFYLTLNLFALVIAWTETNEPAPGLVQAVAT